MFICEGKWLVERLAGSPYDMQSVLVDEQKLRLLPTELPDIPVYVIASSLVKEVVGFNFHRGVMACGYRRPALTFDFALGDLPRTSTVVACADIFDPANLGGILRNCSAFGVDVVLLNRHCIDPLSRRVLRASMGSAFNLRIVESGDLSRDLRRLREELSFEVAATVLDEEAEHLESAGRGRRLALVVGNESQGVPANVIAQCDRQLTIDMPVGTDSLNAAVASGIFLFHFTRVRS